MLKSLLLVFFIFTSKSYSSVSKVKPPDTTFSKGEITSSIIDGLTYKDLYRDHITIDQKWELLKKIRTSNPDFAKKVYLSCLNSLDWVLRSGGIQFLATIDPDLAKSKAIELFKKDPALLVRSAALQVLEQVGAKKYKSELWAALRDSKNYHKGQSLWIRKEIAKNLFILNDEADVNLWSTLLNDSDLNIVDYSVKALEKSSGLILGKADTPLDIKAKLWKERLRY